MSDLQDLRGRLRNAGVEYVVAKNTLARFAAEQTGRTSIVEDLIGPTAIAFGSDPVATAKALQDFTRVNRVVRAEVGPAGRPSPGRAGGRAAGIVAARGAAARARFSA